MPKSEHTTVSKFMHDLEDNIRKPTTYAGELYLELHRGTLTNQHPIKRNNRKLEIALHNLEAATVAKAVAAGVPADKADIDPMTESLLVNQFHDILPGTCIHRAHAESIAETSAAIEKANEMTRALLTAENGKLTLTNLNSFDLDGTQTVYLPAEGLDGIEGALTQKVTDRDGKQLLAVAGMKIPAYGAAEIKAAEEKAADSAFTVNGKHIETPFAIIEMDDNGGFASFIDKRTGRELVNGLPFNTFLMAEDMPAAWDNWDVDADLEEKMRPVKGLVSCEVVANGVLELRLRMVHKLTGISTVYQDVIFSSVSPMVVFDTVIDWQEAHRFLKTAFDTSLVADGVINEIQFGNIRRSNHRSTDVEKARFEICNHKYTDLTERNNGFALLNDCKYGLSANEGSLRLSLHKGGILPDELGDKGMHEMKYAILPHMGGFAAETVIQPAYAFNNPPMLTTGEAAASLVSISTPDVIIETVKPCEDKQNAYILRLYEATGGYTKAALTFGHDVKGLKLTNMLEDEKEVLDNAELTFRPFEIKTIKVEY